MQLDDSQKIYTFIFALYLIGFVLFKWSHLDIAFFWDESWVYAPAISYMADNGPSIFPGKVDLYLTRGHPLFFHFLGGCWLSIFGKSMISYHGFALFISVFSLSAMFLSIRQLWDDKIAFFSTTFTGVQLMFLAQSSMVLPEVLVMILCFLSIYYSVTSKWKSYIVIGSLLLLTKESGLVCIMACNLFFFFRVVFSKSSFLEFGKSLLPYLSLIIFFIVQKLEYGWFFYPEHVDMMNFSLDAVKSKLAIILDVMFVQQYRVYFFGVVLVLTLLSFEQILRIKLYKSQRKFLVCSLIFILAYSLFSALNFITMRYILILFPFTFLFSSIAIVKSLEGIKFLSLGIYFTVISMFIYFHDERFPAFDANLSYLEYCPTQLELVEYLEENNYYNEAIYTDFLNETALKEKYAGYRSSTEKFTTLNDYENQHKPHFKIINSIESAGQKEALANQSNATLIQHFGDEQIWFELYKID